MLSKSRIGFGKSIALAIAAGVLTGCPWPKGDAERFVGTWATEGQSKGMQMVFAADGTLYLVDPAAKPPLAFRGTYRLNTSVRPREIAMTLSDETGVSLYEFAGDRRVTLIQPTLAETLAPLPRSTLTMVSQATTPPPVMPLRDLNEFGRSSARVLPSRIESTEAVKTIASLLRRQQAYFLEQAQFTDDPMRLGLTAPLETSEYAYRIALIDPARVSQITAIAKSG